MALNVLGGNVPSIGNPLPSGIITPPTDTGTFRVTDVQYDYAIAGIPFFAGESLRGSYFRRQYLRNFAPIRKDQFDNQNTPGEQSLLGWWLKSQSSFALGGGSQYLDTSMDTTLGERYLYSEHMDMFSTPYQVKLLPATKKVWSTGNTNLQIVCATSGGTDMVIVSDGLGLVKITSTGAGSTLAMPAGITAIKSLTSDGTNYYFVDTTGIYQGAIATPAVAATKIWNLPSSSGHNVIAWVKGRLVAGLDNNIYELVGTGPTLPTPKFTHQNSAYVFSSIEETPQSILVAGSAGAMSQVHRFTVDAGGALPTLTSGVVTADLPLGETINTLYGYLGDFVALGTSKGIRVATINTNGDLSYGPLVVKNVNGVQAIVGHDRFLVFGNTNNGNVPYDGWSNPSTATTNSGLMRLDLSQTTSTGGYPYCSDLDSHTTGTVVDTDHVGTTVGAQDIHVFTVAGQGVFFTDTTECEPSGVIFSSKIRYNTLEPKHFKYVYIRTPSITDGSIQVVVNDPTGGSTPIFTASNGTTSNAPSLIEQVGNQVEWVQLQFNFTRGTLNNNITPILNGWLLRSLPGPDRQILLTLPLLCFDHELDRKGQKYGYDGAAQKRLAALEAATQSGNLVTLQDLNFGTSYLVIIDEYEFQQQANERGRTSGSNAQDGQSRGGFVILQCRVVQ